MVTILGQLREADHHPPTLDGYASRLESGADGGGGAARRRDTPVPTKPHSHRAAGGRHTVDTHE